MSNGQCYMETLICGESDACLVSPKDLPIEHKRALITRLFIALSGSIFSPRCAAVDSKVDTRGKTFIHVFHFISFIRHGFLSLLGQLFTKFFQTLISITEKIDAHVAQWVVWGVDPDIYHFSVVVGYKNQLFQIHVGPLYFFREYCSDYKTEEKNEIG